MTTMTLTSRNFGSQMSRLYDDVQSGDTLHVTVIRVAPEVSDIPVSGALQSKMDAISSLF